jgi:hypothetical protein
MRLDRARPRLILLVSSLLVGISCHPSYRLLQCHNAHPDAAIGPHDAPIADTEVRLTVDGRTTYSPAQSIALTLTCGGGRMCKALVSVSTGSIHASDATDHMMGCSGKLLATKRQRAAHHLTWRAPVDVTAASMDARFDVTVATGVSRFLQPTTPLVVPPAAASLPASARSMHLLDVAPATPSGSGWPVNLLFLHAWTAAAAFALLFPGAAVAARHFRHHRLWMQLHKWLSLLAAALSLSALAFVEWHHALVAQASLRSWHSWAGACALCLTIGQIGMGLTRPPPASRTRLWAQAHRAVGGAVLATGLLATWFGLQKKMSADGLLGVFRAGFPAYLGLGTVGWLALEGRRYQACRRSKMRGGEESMHLIKLERTPFPP